MARKFLCTCEKFYLPTCGIVRCPSCGSVYSADVDEKGRFKGIDYWSQLGWWPVPVIYIP